LLEKGKIIEKKRLKGISTVTVNKDISWENYKQALLIAKVQYHPMHTMKSVKHRINVYKLIKKSLGPYDDKRYILPDGITTIPFGDTLKKIFLDQFPPDLTCVNKEEWREAIRIKFEVSNDYEQFIKEINEQYDIDQEMDSVDFSELF